MELDVREEPLERLAEYAGVSAAFLVDRVLEPEGAGLPERLIAAPYTKDYDAIPGNAPRDWPRRQDASAWQLFAAWAEGRRVGGAIVVRAEPAILQDLRVAPDLRGRGIGSALLAAAERWARAQRCRRLEIETQSTNVAACRLYGARGYRLASISRNAYPELPEEIQLVWSKDLAE